MAQSHRDNLAARKAGGAPGWEPFRWEVITGGLILIKGGVPRMVGGRKKWDEEDAVKVVVSQDEIKEEYRRYEAETGKCGECFGEEKVCAGWGSDTGLRFIPCPKCQVKASE